MGKGRLDQKKQKVFFSIFVVIILIVTIFTVITYSKINAISKDLNTDNKEMSVKIFADKESGYIPFTVNFSSIVLNDQEKLSYFWEFGDGETSEEKNPSHTYKTNISTKCKLTIKTENGKKATDFFEISILNNRPPKVSIVLSTTSPERAFAFKPSYLILRWGTKSHGGRNLYYLRKMGMAPLSEEKSNVNATALVSDPDGDKIVSYSWELKPPTVTLFGMKPIHPVYEYSGKSVIFDLLDIYNKGKYDLKLTVEDEFGNIDVETVQFEVEENPKESTTFGMADYIKGQWLKQYSKMPAIKAAVAGVITILLYNNFISKRMSLPVLKLIIMAVLSTLTIKPEEYANETMVDVLCQVLEKYKFLKPLTKNLFDKIENILINVGLNDEAENLQILEEQLGLDNNRPTISEQFPIIDSKNIPRNCPYVSIKVEDLEGDSFDVAISGDYVNSTTYTDVANNTFNATFNYPTPQGLPATKDINWNVKVVDQNGKIVSESYKFTTFA